MKLIVQIPCLNEEKTLPAVIRDIPRKIEGIDKVEILVIDDGSTDKTSEVARQCGVDYVLRLNTHMGLARAFRAGIQEALRLGADIIVNTDGDNQYYGGDIKKLIRPILEKKADIVIGERDIDNIKEFSFIKKKLQRIGSWVVRKLSGTNVPDATSGFRAYSRDAAMRMNILSPFSYTLETLIQAGMENLTVVSVPIRTNPKTRESRLFKNIFSYIKNSGVTLIRIYTMHRPLKVFVYAGIVSFILGFILGIRFLIYYFHGGTGKVQSVVLCAVFLIFGLMLSLIGMVTDLIAANRKMIEEALYRLRKMEYDKDKKD